MPPIESTGAAPVEGSAKAQSAKGSPIAALPGAPDQSMPLTLADPNKTSAAFDASKSTIVDRDATTNTYLNPDGTKTMEVSPTPIKLPAG